MRFIGKSNCKGERVIMLKYHWAVLKDIVLCLRYSSDYKNAIRAIGLSGDTVEKFYHKPEKWRFIIWRSLECVDGVIWLSSLMRLRGGLSSMWLTCDTYERMGQFYIED